jgi:hypothetical protein
MRSLPQHSPVPAPSAAFAESAGVVSPLVIVPMTLPHSVAIGRTIRRIQAAENARQDLQREAERLLKMGHVMQQD